MYEYKILTQRDGLFRGHFDPEELQEQLNRYAAGGWRLAEGFLFQNVWKRSKAETVLVLERALRPVAEEEA